jgi:ketosteroid isomerase-like protein
MLKYVVRKFQKTILFGILCFLAACAATKQTGASADVLLQADIEFSNLSKAQGVKAAFLHYMDDSAVLLKPDAYPIIGSAAKQYYENQSGDINLTWSPQAAFLSKSGELGYTYGIWSLASTDTTLQGTYVTIWKKGKDGRWKFVLDTGNSGVGKK